MSKFNDGYQCYPNAKMGMSTAGSGLRKVGITGATGNDTMKLSTKSMLPAGTGNKSMSHKKGY